MSQKSLNDLLRAEDKAGWIEKKREGLGCGIKELEASWNRNVERYKMTLPSKKTQLKTLLERATKYSKGIRYRDSSAYNKQSNKKSPTKKKRKKKKKSNSVKKTVAKKLAAAIWATSADDGDDNYNNSGTVIAEEESPQKYQ